MISVNTYEDAVSVARTSSKAQSKTASVYQTGAAEFVACLEGEAVRGVLCAQFKNGHCVADPRSNEVPA